MQSSTVEVLSVHSRRFLLYWVAANSIGYALSIGSVATNVLALGAASLFAPANAETTDLLAMSVPFAVILALIFSSALGFFQSLVLRRSPQPPRRWILGTTVGVIAGLLLVVAIGTLVTSPANFDAWAIEEGSPLELFVFPIFWAVAFGLLLGAVLGVSQSMIVRGGLHKTAGWTVATTFGVAAAAGLAALLGDTVPESLSRALGGAVLGLITLLPLRRVAAVPEIAGPPNDR